MRTPYFRYIAWVEFDKVTLQPVNLSAPFLDEELYDHRKEILQDFTHRETTNVVKRPDFEANLKKLRERMLDFLKNEVIYKKGEI